jgi:hypothetical protein
MVVCKHIGKLQYRKQIHHSYQRLRWWSVSTGGVWSVNHGSGLLVCVSLSQMSDWLMASTGMTGCYSIYGFEYKPARECVTYQVRSSVS